MNYQVIVKQRGVLEQEQQSFQYLSYDEKCFGFSDSPLLSFVPSCFSSNESQQLFFAQNIQPLVDASLLQQQPQLVIALGLESSGKTYTIEGISTMPSQQGLLPRIIEYLLQEKADQIQYNCVGITQQQQIYDLIKPFKQESTIQPSFHRDIPQFNGPYLSSMTQFLEISKMQRESSKLLRGFLETQFRSDTFHKIHLVQFLIQDRKGVMAFVDAGAMGVGGDKQLKLQLSRILLQLRRGRATSAGYSLGKSLSVSKSVGMRQRTLKQQPQSQSAQGYICTREHKLTSLLRAFFRPDALLSLIFCVAPTSSYQNHRFDQEFLGAIFGRGGQIPGDKIRETVTNLAKSKLQTQELAASQSRNRKVAVDLATYTPGVLTNQRLDERDLVVEPQYQRLSDTVQRSQFQEVTQSGLNSKLFQSAANNVISETRAGMLQQQYQMYPFQPVDHARQQEVQEQKPENEYPLPIQQNPSEQLSGVQPQSQGLQIQQQPDFQLPTQYIPFEQPLDFNDHLDLKTKQQVSKQEVQQAQFPSQVHHGSNKQDAILIEQLRNELLNEKQKNLMYENQKDEIRKTLVQEATQVVRDRFEKQKQIVQNLERQLAQKDDQLYDLKITFQQLQRSVNVQAQQQEYVNSIGVKSLQQVNQSVESTKIATLEIRISELTQQLQLKNEEMRQLFTKIELLESVKQESEKTKTVNIGVTNRLGVLQQENERLKADLDNKQNSYESQINQTSALQAKSLVLQDKLEDFELVKADCVSKGYEIQRLKEELQQYKCAIWDAEREVQEVELKYEALLVEKEGKDKECELLRQYASSEVVRVEDK